MFETKIQNTKLAGSLADCMFRRINGCDYEGDISFLSTLRALLMNRMPADDSIAFRSYSVAFRELTTEYLSACTQPNTIVYVSVSREMTDDEETAKQTFFAVQAPEKLHEFADVRTFFAEKMTCRAFVCSETKSSIIMVLSSNMKKHHLAQCILPKLLPWYFEQGRISVNEREILYALRNRMPTPYLHAMDVLCDTDAFRQKSATTMLVLCKRKGLERQKADVERSIAHINSAIDSLNYDLLEQMRLANQENFKLNGILLAMESDEDNSDDVAQFIANNKNVQLIAFENSELIQFVVTGYLDLYDPEAYRSMSRNVSSWYWIGNATARGPFMRYENRKLVMDSIFGDSPTFKIKTFGTYSLDLNRCSVSADGEEHSPITENRYANPHLRYAHCLGSYRMHISNALSKGDLVGAIGHCITSVHSVNVTESATFRHLCQDIFADERPILEGKDGQSYTTLQAYEYLSSKNQA